jgi:hypothetical protein
MKVRLPGFISCFMIWLACTAQINGQTLVHYWNFNNSADEAALLTPSASLVGGAAIVHIPGGISAIQATSNTGQGFDVTNPNARNGDVAGTHLRLNDPIGGNAGFFTADYRLSAGCGKIRYPSLRFRRRCAKN